MTANKEFWTGKKVLLTGHTGFKGSWLAFWLHRLGAQVTGCSLDPTTSQSLFNCLSISSLLNDYRENISDFSKIVDILSNTEPEIVIHMAAQSIVRESYRNPVETFTTNVMGTVNLLEAVRSVDSIRVVLIVTSDKCYDNANATLPFSETDPFGGQDPYSSSKGCAELVTRSFRDSFFNSQFESNISVASARAGNVIGGGDWAADRLVPDAMRAFGKGDALFVRFPTATRPWQHVLEPLSGYLLLCERMWYEPNRYSSGWNFGPEVEDNVTVATFCNCLVDKYGPNAAWSPSVGPKTKLHESERLHLSISKAKKELNWLPKWTLDVAITKTVEWYKLFSANGDIITLTAKHIDEYSNS